MEQKTFIDKLNSELERLSFGKVLEVKKLTKSEADNLFNSYSKNYVVRGPLQDSQETRYSLFFELNHHKIGVK